MADASTDLLVVGAGAVGLALARKAAMDGRDVILVEANESFGMETSSRNSEVIHAGIYYQKDSLKAQLCVKGAHA
ncbi:MAG: FAD-dependent oxidoreductase, partial [Alphaproteobacteria bacterium]